MGKKIWQTIHPRKFGCDVSVLRPSVRTLFGGDGRESGVSPSGGGVRFKSWDVFVELEFFLAENRVGNGVAKSSPSKTCLLKKLVFKYF